MATPVGQERSDTELLADHVAGDPAAFDEIFRRHRDRMWAVALRTTGDRELAADCVQEAFISAFRRAGSFRGDSAVSTWLHRIVVNACLDQLRRRRAVVSLDGPEPVDPHDDVLRTDVRLDVQAALARLPEHHRAALVLVDMHAVPVAEAAQILGVPVGTVKSRCARGRAALAEILGMTPRAREPGPPPPRLTDDTAAAGPPDPATAANEPTPAVEGGPT
ncbi:MAG: RNA polymerase sigma factor SigM [Dermatophilaceae bacterium]